MLVDIFWITGLVDLVCENNGKVLYTLLLTEQSLHKCLMSWHLILIINLSFMLFVVMLLDEILADQVKVTFIEMTEKTSYSR